MSLGPIVSAFFDKPLEVINDFEPGKTVMDVEKGRLVVYLQPKRRKGATPLQVWPAENLERVANYLNNYPLTTHLGEIDRDKLTSLHITLHDYNIQLIKEGKPCVRKAEIEMFKYLNDINDSTISDADLEILLEAEPDLKLSSEMIIFLFYNQDVLSFTNLEPSEHQKFLQTFVKHYHLAKRLVKLDPIFNHMTILAFRVIPEEEVENFLRDVEKFQKGDLQEFPLKYLDPKNPNPTVKSLYYQIYGMRLNLGMLANNYRKGELEELERFKIEELPKVTALLSVILNGKDPYEIINLFKVLRSKQNWEGLLQNIILITAKVEVDFSEVIMTLHKIPTSDQKRVIDAILPYTKEMTSGLTVATFLSVFKRISPELHTKMGKELETLDNIIHPGWNFTYFLESLPIELLTTENVALIRSEWWSFNHHLVAQILLEKIPREDLTAELLRSLITTTNENNIFNSNDLEAVPKKEIAALLIKAKNYCLKNSIPFHSEFIYLIYLFPESFLEESKVGRFPLTMYYFDEVYNQASQHLIEKLDSVVDDRDQLQILLQLLDSRCFPANKLKDDLFTRLSPDLHRKIAEFQLLLLIPENEITQNLRANLHSFILNDSTINDVSIETIFATLKSIPHKDRTKLIEKASKLIEVLKKDYTFKPTLKAVLLFCYLFPDSFIQEIPKQNLTKFFTSYKGDLSWLIDNEASKSRLIEYILFKLEEKENTHEDLKLKVKLIDRISFRSYFFDNLELKKKIQLYETLLILKHEELSPHVMDETLFIIENSNFSRDKALFEILEYFPLSERVRIIRDSCTLIKKLDNRPSQTDSILYLTSIFPLSFIDQINPTLLNNYLGQLNPENISSLLSDPLIKEQAAQFMILSLDNVMADREELKKQLHLIENPSSYLNLPEDHPLFFKIAQAKILASEETTSINNPYRIYLMLKEGIEDQKGLLPEYHQITSAEGALDLQRVREMKREYTYKELPEASFETLHHIFMHLKDRIESLMIEERERVEKNVVDEYGATLQNILGRSQLITDQTIKDWLMRTGKPDEICDPILYKLRAIIVHLDKQSDGAIQPNGLSPKEELFLTWSESIYACSSGLREGIDLIFGSLGPEFSAHHGYYEIVQKLTTNAFQHRMQSILRSQEFLKETTEASVVQQGNHQIQFLMNRLYILIGLTHSLTFDPHTHTLYNELISKDLKTLAEIYFKHFTLDSVLKQMQVDFNAALTTKASLALSDYFQKEVGTYINKYMEVVDEDTYTYGLSREGALEILRTLKCFNPYP